MPICALSIASAVEERLDRLGVHVGDEGLGLRQHAGPRVAVAQAGAFGQRLAQQRAFVIRIRPVAGRPECGDALAIGLDQRHVDAVERGPAHQPDRLDRPHPIAPFARR